MPGDFKEEEFSKEELEALGESSTEEQAPESQSVETEVKPEEEKPEETKVEDTKTEQAASNPESAPEVPEEKIDPVQKRIDKLTWEKNETERKLTLFKQLGADEYYKLYPDETPEGYQAKQPDKSAEQKPNATDVLRLTVQGGDYDGYTLGDLLGSADANERAVGAVLLDDYHRRENAVKAEQETAQRRYQEFTQREINAFEYNLAKETFGKDKDFTAEEVQQIRSITPQVINWMRQKDPVTGRSRVGYTFQDAYFIMNKDNLIKKAKTDAASKAVDAMTKPGVKSIGSGDGEVKPTGYEAMMNMTEAQFEKAIDKMPEKEFAKFLKEAPKALRDKYPAIF